MIHFFVCVCVYVQVRTIYILKKKIVGTNKTNIKFLAFYTSGRMDL